MLFRDLVSTLLLVTLTGAAFASSDGDDYSEYSGTYEFEDGVRVTGGRFDEAGEVMLLYLDTETIRRGGVFIREDGTLKGRFGARELSFEERGDLMRWRTLEDDILMARRVMKPQTRAARFANGDISLAGTLYLPPGDGPFPAVVIAHGSGPVNRYAGAWTGFFLEQGMAVLGFDKRGVGQSTGDWREASYAELADDLGAAVGWLGMQKDIDDKRLGLSSTSQSGWYAPSAALDNPSVAFLLQRAGPAVNVGMGTNHERIEEWKAEGLDDTSIQAAAGFRMALHELARSGGALESAQTRLEEARRQPWFEPAFGNWKTVEPGWWRQLTANMQLEPAKDTAQLRIPVLWFLAERDENVPYAASMAALARTKQRNPELTVVTIHDAGHSFLVRDENDNLRYADGYWQVMAGWLAEHGFSGSSKD